MVFGLMDNLFFKAKVNEAGKQAGVQISFAKDADKALDSIRENKPELIILDLDAVTCRPMELLLKLKADEQLKDIPTIGFVAHVHANVQKDADDAGCDRILARSNFERVLIATLQDLKK